MRSGTDRTVEASLSSEFPVKRFDGEEILSHRPEAVDLDRVPLPLIRGHDDKDLPVGIVENMRVSNGRLKGVLRFSNNQDALWADVQAGIIRNLSIGYFVQSRKRTANGYLVTKWQPYECSLVAAGADPSVGINRSIRKESRSMDVNDLLKSKKQTVDKMATIQKRENITADDQAEFDGLKTELENIDNRLSMADDVRTATDDLKNRGTFQPEIKRDNSIITLEGGPVEDRTYAGMFGAVVADEREMAQFRASMVEGVGSSGGFAVPEQLSKSWLDTSLPEEIIRSRATVWPMTSATRSVPGWSAADMSGGDFFGGLSLSWLAEEEAGTKKTGTLRKITLGANKAGLYCDASAEVVEDGAGFDAQLQMALKKSLSLGLDHAFLRGTGAGQPLGILNDPAIISQAKETGQDADTIVYENIVKMFSRHYNPKRGVWICNSTTIPQLMQLNITLGTGGDHIRVFNERDGKFTLLGRPVLFSPSMPVLGDANDIIFADLSQYLIGIRRSMRIERSPIPLWTQDMHSFRVLVRLDGQGSWDTYITPRNGDTLSWVVGLAERA